MDKKAALDSLYGQVLGNLGLGTGMKAPAPAPATPSAPVAPAPAPAAKPAPVATPAPTPAPAKPAVPESKVTPPAPVSQPQAPAPGAALMDTLKGFASQAGDMLSKPVDAAKEQMVKQLEQTVPGDPDSPGAVGWKDWLTNNWKTALVPAGALMYLYGGNLGKLLGVMAMGLGGHNLYQRYDRLTNPQNEYNKPFRAALMTALNQRDEQGNSNPFSNFDQAAMVGAQTMGNTQAIPVMKEMLLDFAFATSHGAKNMVMGKAYDEAGLQRPQPTTNVADQPLLQRIMSQAGNAYRQLVPDGKVP